MYSLFMFLLNIFMELCWKSAVFSGANGGCLFPKTPATGFP